MRVWTPLWCCLVDLLTEEKAVVGSYLPKTEEMISRTANFSSLLEHYPKLEGLPQRCCAAGGLVKDEGSNCSPAGEARLWYIQRPATPVR